MISDFRGPYFFLNSDFPWRVSNGEYVYPTISHAMESIFIISKGAKSSIGNCQTIKEARNFASKQRKSIPPNKEAFEIDVMKQLLAAKFGSNELRRKLIETGNEELVFENSRKDTFWGVYNGEGKNKLGILLMELRESLKNSSGRRH